MSLQTFVETLLYTTADGPAIANSAAEALITPDWVIPANYLYQGRTFRATMVGRVSNVVTAVPTMTFRSRIGATSLTGTQSATSGALAARATAATNETWLAEWLITCRSSGTGGTMFTTGRLILPNVTGATATVPLSILVPSTAPATSAIDTTVQNFLGFTFAWSAANAANSVQVHQYTLEAMN